MPNALERKGDILAARAFDVVFLGESLIITAPRYDTCQEEFRRLRSEGEKAPVADA